MNWWNFSEAGNGKRPVDGVGPAIKRLADKCVLADEQTADAHSLCLALKPLTDISIFK